MKKIVFPFLFVVMLGFSGCIKPGDNIQTFSTFGIVELNWEIFQLTLKTPIGPVYASTLQTDPDLSEHDAVAASFSINFDQQTSDKYYVTSDLQAVKVNRESAEATPGGESMSGDFDLPIDDIGIWGNVGYTIFFEFAHKNATNQDTFLYEMTYDNEQTEGTPVVKIRAKKNSGGSKRAVCAFDMYIFFWINRDDDNKVKFNIQYKTGVDEDGNDVYSYCKDNSGNVITFNAEVE